MFSTPGTDLFETSVVYPSENSPSLFWQQRQHPSIEANLARRGLMIGLEMQGDNLKFSLVGNLNKKSCTLFKQFVMITIAQGYRKVIFDLTNLQTVDGTGVAALVWVRNQLTENSGQLTVCNLPRKVRKTLFAVNFQYLVNIADYEYR
jgi:anti-anti-sigma factor